MADDKAGTKMNKGGPLPVTPGTGQPKTNVPQEGARPQGDKASIPSGGPLPFLEKTPDNGKPPWKDLK